MLGGVVRLPVMSRPVAVPVMAKLVIKGRTRDHGCGWPGGWRSGSPPPCPATAEQVIERYASRWSIEIAIEDAKQVFGTGQARNRTAAAVERTVPFQIACQAVAVTWYATAGHDPADLRERRAASPWYTSKAEPSTADMAAKLRRVIIAARFKASRTDQPTPEEISLLRLAWEDVAA